VLLTSAAAPRFAADRLGKLRELPAFAVGEATAAAARAAGFTDIHIGSGDGLAARSLAEAAGHSQILHIAGQDFRPLTPMVWVVYAAIARTGLSQTALTALRRPAGILLHSARAAKRFAELVGQAGLPRDPLGLAAISATVLAAAGSGWRKSVVAAAPNDESLLVAAQSLLLDK
jgi:uroporphyrinogen-III synthase